ncbi:MAG: winged helix-turn-helix transcriptional regulator [Cyanobacteria bacterium SZAS TMP-1]|nr:winged helix-turn-helix transcriptional regulator [Cyanobacteria bacterium SZAS TMP-1]
MDKNSIIDLSKCAQIGANCTCFSLRKASRAITQRYDQSLSPLGITASQFSLLNAAALASGLPISELADILVMDRTTLSRNLKPLVENGYIGMKEGQDKRVRSIELTQQGKAILLKAIPIWEDLQEETMQRLGKNNWKDLMEKLRATVAIANLT